MTKRNLCLALLTIAIASSGFAAVGNYCGPGGHAPLAPSAVDDSAFVSQVGIGVTIPVLANDIVDQTGNLLITGVTLTQPALGTVTISGDKKTISYQPTTLADYSFKYQITDQNQADSQSEATVYV